MMRRQTLATFGFLFLGALVCTPSRAQDSLADKALSTGSVAVDILENNQNGEYDCHGRNARVMGNDNKVLFRNCKIVSIPGNQNTVTIHGAQLIQVHGSSNIIHWAGEKKPRTAIFGDNNLVSEVARGGQASDAEPAQGKAGGPAIVIDQATQRNYRAECDGRDVKVQAAAVRWCFMETVERFSYSRRVLVLRLMGRSVFGSKEQEIPCDGCDALPLFQTRGSITRSALLRTDCEG